MDDLQYSVIPADSHRKFCDLITASSVGGMVEDDPDGDFAALEAPVIDVDALKGFAAFAALDAFSAYDAVIDPDYPVTKDYISDHQSDLGHCRRPAHITAQRESR